MDSIVGARGFAHHCNPLGVATKRGYVFVHPRQTGSEVMQRRILDGHFRVVEPAEYPQPVGDRNHYHTLLGQLLTVIVRLVTPTALVAAAMDIDHDRERPFGLQICPHVEVQTVLGVLGCHHKIGVNAHARHHAAIPLDATICLHASGCKFRRVDRLPIGLPRHRSRPASLTDRRFGKRQSQKRGYPVWFLDTVNYGAA